jgi:hypothetical protein
MDAATLYMVVKMASGVEYVDKVYPLKSVAECRKSARHLKRSRIVGEYKRRGLRLKVYCGRAPKILVIAR